MFVPRMLPSTPAIAFRSLQLATVLASGAAGTAWAQTRQPYSLTLTMETINGLQPNDALIGIDLHNLRSTPIRIASADFPDVDYDVVVVDQNGIVQRKTRRGEIRAKDDFPEPGKFLSHLRLRLMDVDAGGTFHQNFDVADAYDLEPGRYSIQVARRHVYTDIEKHTVSNVLQFDVK